MLDFASIGQAIELFSSIHQKIENKVVVLSALRAILDVFTNLRHTQTLLKLLQKLTVPYILPIHEKIKCQLSLLADGISSVDSTSNEITVSHDLTCTLARNDLTKIQSIPHFNK